MLRIVDLTQLHPGIAGDEILTISVNVDGQAVARVGVPASAGIGKVSGGVAMAAHQIARSPDRLC